MTSYGIGVNNRYALFDEEQSTPQETPAPAPPVAKQPPRDNINKGPAKAGEGNKAGFPPKKPFNQRGNQGDDRTNQRRGPRPERTPRPEGQEGGHSAPVPLEDRNNHHTAFQSGEGRGEGGAGRGAGRGGRGGFRPPHRNMGDRAPRNFEGGVKPFEKRGGGGRGNWGKQTEVPAGDVIEGTDSSVARGGESTDFSWDASKGAAPVDGTAAPAANDSGVGEDVENAQPKEPEQLTLEEYKKKEEEARAVPSFNLRKAGEGVDKKQKDQWKNTVLLKKEEEHDGPHEEKVVYYIEKDSKKKVLPVGEVKYIKNRDGRGFRGEKLVEGARQGYQRAGNKPSQPPKVNDTAEFPSLN